MHCIHPPVLDNIQPTDIFNLDEGGFSAAAENRQIACPVGERSTLITGAEHGDKVSAVFIINASGHAADPFYILSGARPVADQLDSQGKLHGVVNGSAFTFAKKSNMTDEVRAATM